MGRNRTFEFERSVGEDEELTLYVRGYVTESRPATMYKRNGDPGDPAEGGDVEIEEIYVTDENGIVVEYDVDQSWLEEECAEEASEGYDSRYDERDPPPEAD